jgi:hypothetical protein
MSVPNHSTSPAPETVRRWWLLTGVAVVVLVAGWMVWSTASTVGLSHSRNAARAAKTSAQASASALAPIASEGKAIAAQIETECKTDGRFRADHPQLCPRASQLATATPTLIPGPAGRQGPQGIQGLPGPRGSQGPPGKTVTGPMGEPGAAGAAGRQGDVGGTGPAGPSGPAGDTVTGPPGPSGPEGPAGKDAVPQPFDFTFTIPPRNPADSTVTVTVHCTWNGSTYDCPTTQTSTEPSPTPGGTS